MSIFGAISLIVIIYVVARSVAKAMKSRTYTDEQPPKPTNTLKDKYAAVEEDARASIKRKLAKTDDSVQAPQQGGAEGTLSMDAKKARIQPAEQDAYNEVTSGELLTSLEKGVIFSEILSKPKALRR